MTFTSQFEEIEHRGHFQYTLFDSYCLKTNL